MDNNVDNSFKIKNKNNNSPNSYDSTDGNSLIKENNFDANHTEDLMKFIKSLSIPLVNFLCTPKGTLEVQKKIGKPNNECKILLINLLERE